MFPTPFSLCIPFNSCIFAESEFLILVHSEEIDNNKHLLGAYYMAGCFLNPRPSRLIEDISRNKKK